MFKCILKLKYSKTGSSQETLMGTTHNVYTSERLHYFVQANKLTTFILPRNAKHS